MIGRYSLTEIAKLVKTKRFLLLAILSLAITILIIGVVTSYFSKKAGVPFRGIYPGQSSEETLIRQLGQPLNLEVQGSQKLYSFTSDNQFRHHQAIVTNKTVELIKEQVTTGERGALNRYLANYGKPEKILFGPYASVGFKVYLFAQRGIAVIANQNDGVVIEIWYFKPQTIQEFMAGIGKDLKENPEVMF